MPIYRVIECATYLDVQPVVDSSGDRTQNMGLYRVLVAVRLRDHQRMLSTLDGVRRVLIDLLGKLYSRREKF